MNLPTATLMLTGAIGCVTVYIARRQAKTAKNKFRPDLFDRRFSIFEAVMRLAEAAVYKPKLTSEDVTQFRIAIRGVRFFFNKSLEDYCKELRKEAVGLERDNGTVYLVSQDFSPAKTHRDINYIDAVLIRLRKSNSTT